MGNDRAGDERSIEITATMELFQPREAADIHRAIVSMLSELDSKEVVRQLVGAATRILGGEFGFLFLFNEQGELELSRHKGTLRRSGRDENAERVADRGTASLIIEKSELGRSLVGDDPLPASIVYCPLKTRKHVRGVIGIGSYQRLYSFKEIRALSLLAQPAALLIESARLYEESTTLGNQLSVLAEAQRILTEENLDVAFPSFCRALRGLLTFDLGLFLEYQSETQEYVVRQAWTPRQDHDPGWIERRVNAGRSLHARALGGAAQSRIDDLQSAGEGLERAWLTGAGMRSGLVVPLMSFERAVGSFSLWARVDSAFNSKDSELVLSLGQQLALAVKNQRLFEQLERAKTEWESTFDSMKDAVWIMDTGQRVYRFNKAFKDAVAGDNEQILQSSASDLINVNPFDLNFRPGEETRQGRFRREIVGSKLGNVVEVVATRIPFDADGRLVLVARDVSEARAMNARFQQASRLAGIGQLASAVAHEINNPLSYIAANLDRIKERAEASQSASKGAQMSAAEVVRELPMLAGESLDGVSRVKRIVEMLQIYASGSDGETTFDLNELVEFCLTLVWATLRRSALLDKHLGSLPPYHGDQHRLSQVLVNILVSAARSVGSSRVEQNSLELRTSYERESWMISISASRAGTPVYLNEDGSFESSEDSERDPLSSGLWLKPDYEIIRELGGSVLFAGDGPQPSVVTILLPRRSPRSSVSFNAVSTLPGIKALEGRILIIDDEPYVRRALQRVLSASHDVVVARGGEQALELLESSPLGFDVILCDVVMPGMSGLDFAHVLEEQRPNLRDSLIFITGGVFSLEAEAELHRGPNPVLKKPIQPKELVLAVEQVLARGLHPTSNT